jgi:ferredoxin
MQLVLKYEIQFVDYNTILPQVKILKNAIIEFGSSIAIKEIEYQCEMLRYCESCQVGIIKQQHLHQHVTNPMILVKHISERAIRILDFMEVYLLKYSLQCIALDALLLFVQTKNLSAIITCTKLIPLVGKVLKEYIATKPGIIWRACLVLQSLSLLDRNLAKDIALLHIHDMLLEQYPRLTSRPRIQQIILRFLGSLVIWHSQDLSRIIIQQSLKCMTMLVQLEKTAQETRDQIRLVNVAEKDDYRKKYTVILPLEIRTFLRESKGEVLMTAPEVAETPAQLERKEALKNVNVLKPLFGTANSKIFAEGEKGLLD